ncbi:HTTM domain-containing protein [Blastopirellula marina]|uniref:HTTM-like domain-containing protein n=1 Tax=Blastopirellula marina TaxID=124 RepID=A0A2S8FHJ4_9BACT|nr:HTTM domain-containing protein [Blastopirellula marina]PQO31637.1 hypothetical protein C5Y98_19675 [Blastopirellula marina]PTL42944.1 hypothetical protein C5Y97_19685 [Blastopirellula marina]
MKAAARSANSSVNVFDAIRIQLATQVDASSLAIFRICFGLVMAWHMLKYFESPFGVTEIERVFGSPALHFTYPGFGWVQPWSEPWLTVHFAVVGIAAVLVALGLFYRAACITLFLGYTYIFLLEATLYNNHYYLICLLSFLLIFMPANRCWSLDRLIAGRFTGSQTDADRVPTISFWPIFLLRFQLFVVYFYGGIAKLNADWLTGEPLYTPGATLHNFLASTIGLPAAIQPIHLCLFLAWAGLFYDLSIGFLLLWKKTRWVGLLATALFHIHNHFIFPIGIFPAMALSSTLIFLDPNWPRQLATWIQRPRWPFTKQTVMEKRKEKPARTRLAMGMTVALGAFVIWQATWPLRHLFIPGDANWTEEGQDFAWRMMLRAKAAGHLTCRVVDPNLHIVTDNGRPAIRWEACPAGTPQAIHIAIDSHLFVWSHHPGLTITQEPIFGRRLIYNPSSLHTDRQEAIEMGQHNIREQWEKTFARVPTIEATISLPEAVTLIRERFEAEADKLKLSPAVRAEFVTQLAELQQQDEANTEETPGREPRRVRLVNALDRLYHSPLAAMVRPVIRRIEPFVLQGAPASGKPLLVISDPQLDQAWSAEVEADLLKLSDGEPYIVWTDFSRLRPDDWRRLPTSFVTFEERQLQMVWNHFQEIEPHQLEKAAVRPWMIHQYAQHVGNRWQEITGRQAEVRVESYVMMNYTMPQMLIDPQVDLASATLSTFGHNAWILPRNHQRLGIAEKPQPASIRR